MRVRRGVQPTKIIVSWKDDEGVVSEGRRAASFGEYLELPRSRLWFDLLAVRFRHPHFKSEQLLAGKRPVA